MEKKFELLRESSCLNKAASDEPLFVLRAKDPAAPQAIRLWVEMSRGQQPDEKLAEALDLAERMREWRNKNTPEAAPGPVNARI